MWSKQKSSAAPATHPIRKPFRQIVLPLLLLALSPVHAESVADELESALSGPVRVELNDGRSFSGQPVAFRDDVLLLRMRIDGGEADRGFPRSDIAEVNFPGEKVVAEAAELLEDGELTEALPLLEAIWRQRAPYMAIVDTPTLELVSALPFVHLETGDPYRAIGLAKNLLPHAADEVADTLHEAILLGHYRLEFYKETEELAREWIRAQEEFPASALGWKILADLALREDDFEKVVWIALQPIAIAGPQPVKHLDGCYALAIHAFHEMENPDRAQRLHREMTARGLAWPEDEVLAETGEFYQSKLAEAVAESEAAEAEADLDLRPPEEDLNLPLQNVRKILRVEDP